MQHTFSSPAKINLFLHVLGQKPDGYHLIQTWFQYLDWCDYLTFNLTPNTSEINPKIKPKIKLEIKLKTENPELLTSLGPTENNLILKAAYVLQKKVEHLNLSLPDVRIILDKQLPIGAGLGGGSSNAATTLVALNYLWNLGLSMSELIELGASLGADVPVFIFGHSAFAEGIGEKLSKLAAPQYYYLILTPKIHISTSVIFQDRRLTRDTPSLTIDTLKHADPLRLYMMHICNDLEPVVCRIALPVQKSLDWLCQFGHAQVTGSGSSVFLGFKTTFEAQKVLNLLPTLLANTPISGKIARAVNTSPLYDNWGVAKW